MTNRRPPFDYRGHQRGGAGSRSGGRDGSRRPVAPVELPSGAGHGWDLLATDASGTLPQFSGVLLSFLTRVTS
ncbi:hypothetical protein GCM10023322_64870 [Rugosimonospora acidiphila]|uniref:Uncharacterized protein n=1 Tax=Rugosimonospora acidiphila TaxID=556531 RepID=A0ABP9SJE3_9ACTN